MAATMHDVSRLAGVSIKTVSNVINDYPYVRDETRRRVLEAIEQLGYTPNLSARSLRSGRTNVISLMIPDLRNAYFAELADSVMRAAAERGLSVLIEQFGDERDREIDVLRQPRSQMVDGVLYSVLALDQSDVDIIAGIATPVVLLGERIFNGPRDHVTMQNVEGARAAGFTPARRRIQRRFPGSASPPPPAAPRAGARRPRVARRTARSARARSYPAPGCAGAAAAPPSRRRPARGRDRPEARPGPGRRAWRRRWPRR